MAELAGTIINSGIVPTDSLDTYRTHDAEYGRDGWRSVVSIADRDSVSSQRRKEGMVVWVKDDGKVYQLVGGITNSNWQEFSSGSGTSGDLSLYTLLTTSAEISGNLQGQIDAIVQEGTSIASSGGSILVHQDGTAFNLEVASAPIQNHNLLEGLQGTGTDYFHLTEYEYGRVSGDSIFVTTTTAAGISGYFDQEITDIHTEIDALISSGVTIVSSDNTVEITQVGPEFDLSVADTLSAYTLLSETISVSGNLQGQIDAITSDRTTIESSGGSIFVTKNSQDFNLEVIDYISKTEVAQVSGGLQYQIDNIDLSDYTLLSTTAEISGNLQSQIDAIDSWTPIAGQGIQITPSGVDYIFSSTTPAPSAIYYSGLQGREVLNDINDTYTITHSEIDSSVSFPVVSLESPNATSDIFIVGVYERTDTSFKVVLNGVPSSDYAILWHITATVSINSNEEDATLTYTVDGDLDTYVTSSGTKSYHYDTEGSLVAISGTGIFATKAFSYDIDGNLTNIEVI